MFERVLIVGNDDLLFQSLMLSQINKEAEFSASLLDWYCIEWTSRLPIRFLMRFQSFHLRLIDVLRSQFVHRYGYDLKRYR